MGSLYGSGAMAPQPPQSLCVYYLSINCRVFFNIALRKKKE